VASGPVVRTRYAVLSGYAGMALCRRRSGAFPLVSVRARPIRTLWTSLRLSDLLTL
jgi:hypothetical protein